MSGGWWHRAVAQLKGWPLRLFTQTPMRRAAVSVWDAWPFSMFATSPWSLNTAVILLLRLCLPSEMRARFGQHGLRPQVGIYWFPRYIPRKGLVQDPPALFIWPGTPLTFDTPAIKTLLLRERFFSWNNYSVVYEECLADVERIGCYYDQG